MCCSMLCIAHCLALPALVAFVPTAALLADAEWLHVALVIAAAPATLWTVSRALRSGSAPLIVAGGAIGLALLMYAAFVETPHETLLTTLGALVLIAVHARSWFLRRPPQRDLAAQ
ncbi:MAG: MerC domain-containing protein [Pseudomonadota bacterium]